MAEKLCELRKKGGGGGAEQVETVLWTNPSPSSTFAAQTVTLSESIDNFDYIAISYCQSTSYPIPSKIIYSVSDFKKSIQTATNDPIVGLCVSDTSNSYGRKAYYVNSTTIGFTLGYRWNSAYSTNNAANPISIIGIKAPFVRATYNHYYKGYFTSSVQSVDLGFVPRYVIVYNSFKTSVSSGTSNIREYDAEVSTTQYYFQGAGTNEMRNIGTIGSSSQFCMEGTVIGTGVASATFANFIDGKMHITAFG